MFHNGDARAVRQTPRGRRDAKVYATAVAVDARHAVGDLKGEGAVRHRVALLVHLLAGLEDEGRRDDRRVVVLAPAGLDAHVA